MYNNFRSEKIKYKYSPVILKFIFEIIALCRRDYPATGPRQWFTMLSACDTGSIINYLSCFCFSPSITLARTFTVALLELLFRHSPSLISMSLYWSGFAYFYQNREEIEMTAAELHGQLNNQFTGNFHCSPNTKLRFVWYINTFC